MRLKVMVAAVAILLGATIAYALIVHGDDVEINPGNLTVVGARGSSKLHLNVFDGRFGESWTALKDAGSVPAELEIAPVPNQYDQVTVKTYLAILGKGVATIPDDPALPPFDARLLMSGPWPASYTALRDDGSSPATLEVNALREYKDVVIRSGASGDVIIELGG